MMKEIHKINKITLLNKLNNFGFLKNKFSLFSNTNAIKRTLDLDKNAQINDKLKHKVFVIQKF